VLLAPESRVRAAADFGAQRRDVYVEGEAFFEVVHDSTRPFTVFAANTSTRDIGTAFAVRSYPGERAVRVVVSHGSVAMSGAGVLKRGDVGRLTDEGAVRVRHGADVDAMLGWTRGVLTFADAPLAQVLADVRRWYGARGPDVRLADAGLDSLPFTGSLEGVPPVQGIALVAATLGLRLEQQGGQVVLHRR
jgi:transmembrane sensor